VDDGSIGPVLHDFDDFPNDRFAGLGSGGRPSADPCASGSRGGLQLNATAPAFGRGSGHQVRDCPVAANRALGRAQVDSQGVCGALQAGDFGIRRVIGCP
jgi:hypothetical protein